MSVSYNGKKIIPAPFVSLQKEYTRSGDDGMVGSNFSINLIGKLLPQKGSPSSSGTFWTSTGYPADETSVNNFASLIRKQEALRHLFAEDGKHLLILDDCNNVPISCYPILTNINFNESQWYSYIDYNIALSTPRISGSLFNEDELLNNDYFDQYLESASEEWSLEPSDEYEGLNKDFVYNLSHNISAVGKRTYNASGLISNGWEQARAWVYPRLGYNTGYAVGTSGLQVPAYYTGYNYKRVENTDIEGGVYTINESWLLSSGSAIEDFSLSITNNIENYINNVSIEGSIKGLEIRSSGYNGIVSRKYDNALSFFNSIVGTSDVNTIYNRALTYSGFSNLNPIPVSKTVGKSPVTGLISYTYEYDTRQTNYVSGAIYEQISVSDTHPANVFGEVSVMGRSAGPVLQDMATYTRRERTLHVDVVVPYYSGVSLMSAVGVAAMNTASPKSDVDDLVSAFYTNLTNNYSSVFVSSDSDSWDIKNGRYTRDVSWVFGNC